MARSTDDGECLRRLRAAIEEDDCGAIDEALEAVEEIEAALPAVLGLLDHRESFVRDAAVGTLAGRRLPTSLGVENRLLERLQREEDEIVLCTICEALEWHGGTASRDPLLRAMEMQGELVRPWAAEALGWIGCDAAHRVALREVARTRDDARLACAAASALVLLGERSFAQEATRAALSNDSATVGLMEFLGQVRRRRPEEDQDILADFAAFLARVDAVFPAHRGQAERLRAAAAASLP
ncbi:MAG: HEAT repeat domain-containing protein [Myxococcota bacterium]